MTFASRTEAGQQLGRYLIQQNVRADLVLGLPRGGVMVADEVARILGCPLDVLVVPSVMHEAFGMVAVEGAAAGALPLVARHSGLAEIGRASCRERV